MVLLTMLNGKKVEVRVDELLDDDERPVFVGLVPFGETDLPFEIDAEQ